MKITKVRITEGGRVVIPAKFRDSLGLKIGQDATLQLIDNALVLMNPTDAIRRAQSMVRKSVSSDVSLVDQLIAERRAEARDE
ncbi:MAG TPA: AbrB/MazE/SpoVT family DNA-binding domain-containing protein [Tepidisphaeraceae bacterium]|jgi:AbrB family looped-hinge helix DNA binding protein